jgi:hypothetical protein
MNANIHTTGNDILKMTNNKLANIYPLHCFDITQKILKVHSLNDYILDLFDPLGKFTYVRDCIRENRVPEYWIIDDPFVQDRQPRNTHINNKTINEDNNESHFKKLNTTSIFSMQTNTNNMEEKSWIKAFNVNQNESNMLFRKQQTMIFNNHKKNSTLGKYKKIFEETSRVKPNEKIMDRISHNSSNVDGRTGVFTSSNKNVFKKMNSVDPVFTLLEEILSKKNIKEKEILFEKQKEQGNFN